MYNERKKNYLDIIIHNCNHLFELIVCLFLAFLTIYTSGFGITAGAHRLWSHRAYKAKWPLRVILILLFTITGQVCVYF